MALKIDLEITGMTSNLEGATYLVLKLVGGEWVLLESGYVGVPFDSEFSIPVSVPTLYEFDKVMVIITDCNGSNYSTAGIAADFIEVSELYKDFSVVHIDDFFVQCENRTLAYTPWDMGDGTILTEEDPFYMYRDNGTFTITNTDFSQDVIITGVTKFSVELEGSVITCTKQSGTEGGWSFGNGDTDESDTVVYKFYENGTYVVEYGEFSATVLVEYYTDMVDRVEGTFVFFNRPNNATGEIYYGDGTSGLEDSHEYAQHGRYEIELDGYHGVINLEAEVAPDIFVTHATNLDDSGVLEFTAVGADTYEFIIEGETFNTNPVIYDFNEVGAGSHTIRCVGSTGNDTKGVYEYEVVVQLNNVAPVINSISYETNLREATFTIDDDSSEALEAGEIYTYSWVFGNGFLSTERNPTITSTVDEEYTAYCDVTDNRTPALTTRSEVITVSVSNTATLGENLLLANNTDLVNMQSDPNGILGKFYFGDITFQNGELFASHLNGSTKGRLLVRFNTLGLEVGDLVRFTVNAKTTTTSTEFNLGTIDGGQLEPSEIVSIPTDGEFHEVSADYRINDATSETSAFRIYGRDDVTISKILIQKVTK